MNGEPYLTLSDLSRRLGLGETMLRSLANANKIPYHKPARRRLFLESEVRAAMAQKKPREEESRENCRAAARRVMRERGLTSP